MYDTAHDALPLVVFYSLRTTRLELLVYVLAPSGLRACALSWVSMSIVTLVERPLVEQLVREVIQVPVDQDWVEHKVWPSSIVLKVVVDLLVLMYTQNTQADRCDNKTITGCV